MGVIFICLGGAILSLEKRTKELEEKSKVKVKVNTDKFDVSSRL